MGDGGGSVLKISLHGGRHLSRSGEIATLEKL